MNIINGFLTIPGEIQIDLNLGTPGIIETDEVNLIQLPDIRIEIILRRVGHGATGELVSKGIGPGFSLIWMILAFFLLQCEIGTLKL